MDSWVKLGDGKRKSGQLKAPPSNRRVRQRAEPENTGSRFVVCPACANSVPRHKSDDHMDYECSSALVTVEEERPPAREHAVSVQPSVIPSAAIGKPKPSLQITKYCRQTRSKIAISLAQLCEEVPCDLIPNFLDDSIANSVLASLLEASSHWQSHTWWVFDQAHQTPRLTCVYPFDTDALGPNEDLKLEFGPMTPRDLCTDLLKQVAHQVQDTVNARMQLRPRPQDVSVHQLQLAMEIEDCFTLGSKSAIFYLTIAGCY